MRGWRWVASAAALATAGGCGSAPPRSQQPATPPPRIEQFGANTGLLFNSRLYGPQQIAAQLESLRRTGATVARSDASWEASEPDPPAGGAHHYNWSFDDLIAGSLAAHGLRWLPVIDYSPPWVRSLAGQDHSPPSSVSDYTAYAGALANRYGAHGTFWHSHPQLHPLPVDDYEIWNEPDNPTFWRPAPNPSAYANLYQRAREAILAAQPGAHVIVGGLTKPTSFLPALLATAPDLRGHIDGVSIHPYGLNPQEVLTRTGAARAALRSLSLATVPLYVTEFGWTTSPPGALDYLPERMRPGYVELAVAALGHSDCGIAAALLYAWVTPERNPADSQDWFGIHPPDGRRSADSEAFTRGIRAAESPAATVAVCGVG